MRHVLFLLLVCVFVLSACNNGENTISNVELTDRESVILGTTTDRSFVFDFNVDSEYKEVEAWVEKYQDGELISNNLFNITTKVKKEGTIVLGVSDIPDQQDMIFALGIGSNGMNGSAKGIESLSERGPEYKQVLWGSIPDGQNAITEEMVLATILYADGDEMSSASTDFYTNPDERLGELENYDVAYVLRVDFKK